MNYHKFKKPLDNLPTGKTLSALDFGNSLLLHLKFR
jgi:hypothetical protein